MLGKIIGLIMESKFIVSNDTNGIFWLVTSITYWIINFNILILNKDRVKYRETNVERGKNKK